MQKLFTILSQSVLNWFNQDNKEPVITDGTAVLITQSTRLDQALLAPCSHEEAAHHRHHKIVIRTVDTDVVVTPVWTHYQQVHSRGMTKIVVEVLLIMSLHYIHCYHLKQMYLWTLLTNVCLMFTARLYWCYKGENLK